MSVSAVARDARIEGEWKKCVSAEQRYQHIKPPERKESCDYVIAAGPNAWGPALKYQTPPILRGEWNYIDAFFWRARARNGLGQYSQAVDDIDRFLELSPGKKFEYWFDNPSQAYEIRAFAHSQLGEYQAALHDLDETEKPSPISYGTRYLLRGDIAMATRDYAAAVKYYEGFVADNPDERVLEKLAVAKRHAGQPQPGGPMPTPGSSPPLPPACKKTYPNLC